MLKLESNLTRWVKGRVHGYLINSVTGHKRDNFEINNVTTYAAADMMARMIGGDSSYVPGHMGFIYGATGTPGLTDPPISRVQTWDDLSDELADPSTVGNILITPMTAQPTYAVNGSSSYYTGNDVTLVSHSGNRTEYGFPLAAPYATDLIDGYYFYHAMLLNRRTVGSSIIYTPFARVSLKGATFPQKLANYELALFWSISIF